MLFTYLYFSTSISHYKIESDYHLYKNKKKYFNKTSEPDLGKSQTIPDRQTLPEHKKYFSIVKLSLKTQKQNLNSMCSLRTRNHHNDLSPDSRPCPHLFQLM